MDVDNDTQYNPWSTQSTAVAMETDTSAGTVTPHEMASMVPAICTAADMETNTSTGALIPHELFFQGNPMHLAKRQSGQRNNELALKTTLQRHGMHGLTQTGCPEQGWRALDAGRHNGKPSKSLIKEEHLTQVLKKQKDNELITLNTRITAAAPSSASNTSTSRVPLLSTQGASTPWALSSSTIPSSTLKTSFSSQRPGMGRTSIKVTHNNVTLPISLLRIKRQSETSEQMPEQQEDIDMDGADLPNINDATLDNASAKELLKMCTLFPKVAVTGKAQLRKDNPVRYSPSKKTAARMEQHEQMSKNEINALQRSICKQFLMLTGIGTLEEFISYEPVEESLVIAFFKGTGNGPKNELYTLDFSPGFRGLRWNHIIINNMVGVVQAKLLQEGHLVDVDNAYIEETLQNLLSLAQQKWAAVIPCFKKGKPELEMQAEVVECLMETGRQANVKALLHAVKDRKHKTRTTIVKKIIYLKTKQRFMQRLVEYLGLGSMSLEETEVRQIGGHEDITQHMMEIDDYGHSVIKRWDKCLPRERENGPRFDEEVHAPAGLPRSLYNPDWLESLEEDDREEMAVSEEVFELLEHVVPEEVTIQEVE
ncbi:hypothetical protein EDD18DRAFT_1105694 [Armillaria luteobubalina]|uniref:Uncharacterized protein n=1 Tax=Armillaria luteobubalina TaxID=153913 RepID=A0AA39UP90_9AGAR|nr:hypothetical protein EDD18DRAFT_1105694 [Armillaria luteobubalina]